MDRIGGDWTKIDKENQITEISFSSKDELVAKITFDILNDKVSVEGDLKRVTELDDNEDFIKMYLDCSKEILKIV